MTTIPLAWDSGITDGNPGDGRTRLNAAALRSASHIIINEADRHGARIGELVSKFALSDVLHVERDGGSGLIVAWVLGDVVNGGGYYKVPVSVRSVEGSFAAHDLVSLHWQGSVEATTQPEPVSQPEPVPVPVALAPVPVVEPPAPSVAVESPALGKSGIDESELVAVLEHYREQIQSLQAELSHLKANAIVGIDTNIEAVLRQMTTRPQG